jgi:hypothetical protein
VKAKAQIVHSIPGRTRLRIHNRRRDRAFFEDIESRVKRFPNVKRVESDALTGSILVHHTSSPVDLLMAAGEEGLGELIDLEAPAPVAQLLRAEVAHFDEAIRQTTAGHLDLGTIAMFGLFALAGVQLIRGNQPVLAVTLAWYAAELLRRWEEHPPASKPSG